MGKRDREDNRSGTEVIQLVPAEVIEDSGQGDASDLFLYRAVIFYW